MPTMDVDLVHAAFGLDWNFWSYLKYHNPRQFATMVKR